MATAPPPTRRPRAPCTHGWQRVQSTVREPVDRAARGLVRRAGGGLRARVILLLASVLALDTADTSMIGAIAGKLEAALHLSNAQLGLLASVPSLFAAVATVPIGVLTDRVTRVRLLAAGAMIWAIAMTASGAAQSFVMLLLTRLALGMATATAGPTLSSLVGDYFPTRERGRVYGWILSGELLGAGFGFVLSGEFAGVLSWRAGFFVLALPSLALAIAIGRMLPEPARGGRSRLEPGATEFHSDAEAPAAPERHEKTIAQRKVDEQSVSPRAELVLHEDPARMSLWTATRYVLRVRTNVILIVASALGYFYFTGVQTFGLVFFSGRYGLGHGMATLLLGLLGAGALAGVVAGGRLADSLLRRGRVNGRVLVGGWSYVIAAPLFLVALLSPSLAFSMPFYVAAATAFAARNPALDAARLDVMHHSLWGRAEAVRTLLRRVIVASAPLLFGVVADELGSSAARTSGQRGFGAHASAQGLHWAFLLLLATLVLSGLLTFRARRTYPRDVATAVASEEATAIG